MLTVTELRPGAALRLHPGFRVSSPTHTSVSLIHVCLAPGSLSSNRLGFHLAAGKDYKYPYFLSLCVYGGRTKLCNHATML
jgi:hypothetical protein